MTIEMDILWYFFVLFIQFGNKKVDSAENCIHINTTLDCRGKNLTSFSGDILKHWNITILYLQHNNINRIEKNTFSAANLLQYVDLSYNNLSDSIESLPVDLFSNLSHLTVLYINHQSQNWTRIRDDLWKHNYNLTSLAIEIPDNVSLPGSISKLTRLTNISLTGNIKELQNTTLESLKNLNITVFKISACKSLTKIDKNALKSLKHLQSLDLSSNPGLSSNAKPYNNYSGLISALKNLDKSDLRILALNRTSGPAIINVIPCKFWPAIATRALTHLFLDHNFLVSVCSENINDYIPNLEVLSLGANRIELLTTTLVVDLAKLESLKLFNLSQQSRPRPKKRAIINAKHTGGVKIMQVSPKLEKVYCSDCLSFAWGAETIVYKFVSNTSVINLKHIDLSKNDISVLKGRISVGQNILKNEIYFDFSKNDCRFFKYHFLEEIALKIVWLDFSQNQMQGYLRGSPFGQMIALEYISLASNKLYYLSQDLFINQTKLKKIILTDNNLHTIDLKIEHMKNLSFVDLNTNYFQLLSTVFTDQLEKMFKQNRNFSVTVQDCSLVCQCQSLKFILFVKKYHSHFANLNETNCTYHKNKIVYLYLTDLDNISGNLTISCSGKAWLYATIVLSSIITVAVVVSIVVYRHKWDIRYCLLHFNTSRKKYAEEEDYLIDYKYDAFIAYHKNEQSWIEHEMVTQLEEGSHGLKLCFHSRDFIPGMPIEENIVQSIEHSRKTVLIISNGFITSGWCKFEFFMARHHWIERGYDQLIVVLKDEDVPLKRMPRSLVGLLRTHTYIEWAHSEEGQKEFWLQLARAIGKKTERNSCHTS